MLENYIQIGLLCIVIFFNFYVASLVYLWSKEGPKLVRAVSDFVSRVDKFIDKDK